MRVDYGYSPNTQKNKLKHDFIMLSPKQRVLHVMISSQSNMKYAACFDFTKTKRKSLNVLVSCEHHRRLEKKSRKAIEGACTKQTPIGQRVKTRKALNCQNVAFLENYEYCIVRKHASGRPENLLIFAVGTFIQ
jgi:hypothetical protein